MDQNNQHLPINQLQPNPLQPRGDFAKAELEELKESIAEHGIIEPLVVAQTPAGYQIIAGERRWRAAKLAGLTEVPVIIKKTTPRGMLEMALIENVQRVDLNPIERAKAFQRLSTEFKLGTSELSKKIGKSDSFVSNSLKLLRLPDALKDGLIGGMISEGHARALMGIKDTRLMIEAYKIILKENGSVRRAEALSRLMNDQINKSRKKRMEPTKDEIQKILENDIEKWRMDLKKSLGKKAEVKLSRSRVQTIVHFTLKGSPEETQTQLEKILQIARE